MNMTTRNFFYIFLILTLIYSYEVNGGHTLNDVHIVSSSELDSVDVYAGQSEPLLLENQFFEETKKVVNQRQLENNGYIKNNIKVYVMGISLPELSIPQNIEASEETKLEYLKSFTQKVCITQVDTRTKGCYKWDGHAQNLNLKSGNYNVIYDLYETREGQTGHVSHSETDITVFANPTTGPSFDCHDKNNLYDKGYCELSASFDSFEPDTCHILYVENDDTQVFSIGTRVNALNCIDNENHPCNCSGGYYEKTAQNPLFHHVLVDINFNLLPRKDVVITFPLQEQEVLEDGSQARLDAMLEVHVLGVNYLGMSKAEKDTLTPKELEIFPDMQVKLCFSKEQDEYCAYHKYYEKHINIRSGEYLVTLTEGREQFDNKNEQGSYTFIRVPSNPTGPIKYTLVRSNDPNNDTGKDYYLLEASFEVEPKQCYLLYVKKDDNSEVYTDEATFETLSCLGGDPFQCGCSQGKYFIPVVKEGNKPILVDKLKYAIPRKFFDYDVNPKYGISLGGIIGVSVTSLFITGVTIAIVVALLKYGRGEL